MSEILPANLLAAIAFAARAHRNQLRKDNQTPYASHTFRVCLIIRQLFGIDDPQVLMAAVLHDTIEDTTTDFDDLAAEFGADMAAWVAQLSKDKRIAEDEREEAYMWTLSTAPWQVKVCKLADMYDNVQDSSQLPPEKRRHTLARLRRYLQALQTQLPEQARRPFEIVSASLTELER
jgi:guanosine-3',5'-bis(diphosphate) 3'-pyrophosphohydrolase